MKNTKKILLALFIAASAGSFSSVSFAEVGEGRVSYGPAQACEMVVEKLKQADAAAAAKAANEAVVAELQQAKDLTKEINASDKVAFKVNAARSAIKKAIIEAKNGHLPEASTLIKEAVTAMGEAKAAI